jgi:glycosyltransferase involved in cell wall biosynthesis
MSIVVPVYMNEDSIPRLVFEMRELSKHIPIELVFVVDGSLDNSYKVLITHLKESKVKAKIFELSRNFGSFDAIRFGLGNSNGDFACVFSADLQEPFTLLHDYYAILSTNDWDVVCATRKNRDDPLAQKLSARFFWWFYQLLINKNIPKNGVDSFACTRQVIEVIRQLREPNTSLIGLIYWVGFRRTSVDYIRVQRLIGSSKWTFRKKYKYMLDSIFSFSALPLRMIQFIGTVGLVFSFLYSIFLVYNFVRNGPAVPGFTTLLLVMLMIYSSTMCAIGILGSYVWRTFQNSQNRPTSIELSRWESE